MKTLSTLGLFLGYEPSEIFGAADPWHEVLKVFGSLCHECKVTEMFVLLCPRL